MVNKQKNNPKHFLIQYKNRSRNDNSKHNPNTINPTFKKREIMTMKASGTQTIPNASWTTYTKFIEDGTSKGWLNNGNFIVPDDGLYQINFTIALDKQGDWNHRFLLGLLINNSGARQIETSQLHTNGYPYLTMSTKISLTKDDEVKFRVYQNKGENMDTLSGNSIFGDIEKIIV